MGGRDYRHRETKKPKKDAKKPTLAEVVPPPVNVTVVKKGKTRGEAPEEEGKE